MSSLVHRPSRTVIAMATYNGVRFLPQQISSILDQSYRDWTLIVRDDGSTDGTRELLRDAASRDSRVELLDDDAGRLDAVGNFARLAVAARDRGADRLLFADQDDVWLLDKVERTLSALDKAEVASTRDMPLLVHSDLALIDGAGAAIHPSFMHLQRIRHESAAPLRTLLVQNFVTGCSMCANAALLQVALPIPSDVAMHDWWFALCAAATGRLVFIPDATAKYRRHESNTVDVRGYWRTLNPLVTSWPAVWLAGVRHHRTTVSQATSLLDRLDETGLPGNAARRLIEGYVAIHQRGSSIERIRQAAALGMRSQTWPRTIALYLRLWRWRDQANRASRSSQRV